MQTKIEVGDWVCGGASGTDDYDEGRVMEIADDGVCMVAWKSGVTTLDDMDSLAKC